MDSSFFFGLVAGMVLGVWSSVAVLYFAYLGAKQRKAPPPAPAQDKQAPADSGYAPQLLTERARQSYRLLINMAQGDAALAQRLIEYERTRAPAAGEESWIENAIDRWRHDNR